MSLVGSLEDLGLGDILQIVSLSRKSGLLLLRCDQGEGRILFRDGLLHGAFMKGEPESLRELVVGGGFLREGELERAEERARAAGIPLREAIAECTDLSIERIDSLRREYVERIALRMFRWRVGEFSFEIREEIAERDAELVVPAGINSQYLMMEATRLGDEGERESGRGESEPDADDDAPLFSGEMEPSEPEDPPTGEWAVPSEPQGNDCEFLDFDSSGPADATRPAADTRATEDTPVEEPAAGAHEALAVATAASAHEALAVATAASAHEALAVATAANIAREPEEEESVSSAPPVQRVSCLIAVDPHLPVLEWTKEVLRESFGRVHIFQQPGDAVTRVRQYLARGELPAVLVGPDLPSDPLTGARNAPELVARLRSQAPRMPIFVAYSAQDEPPTGFSHADVVVMRPSAYELGNRRRWTKLEAAAAELRAVLIPHRELAAVARAEEADAAPALRRLRAMSDRLREASARGEVLSLVLEFASELFPRVAIFMVRDDVAVGMAQLGLPIAGGPDDSMFCQLEIPADGPAWFRSVMESGRAHRGPASDDADRKLAAVLGDRPPAEAYVAPLESGGQVAALLYADHLPESRPIGNTELLEIVLHEAALALERAVLERALAETRSSD